VTRILCKNAFFCTSYMAFNSGMFSREIHESIQVPGYFKMRYAEKAETKLVFCCIVFYSFVLIKQ
jgi:hypothetical protein